MIGDQGHDRLNLRPSGHPAGRLDPAVLGAARELHELRLLHPDPRDVGEVTGNGEVGSHGGIVPHPIKQHQRLHPLMLHHVDYFHPSRSPTIPRRSKTLVQARGYITPPGLLDQAVGLLPGRLVQAWTKIMDYF